MTNQINALIGAGDKASQGEWESNGNLEGMPEYSVFIRWGKKFATLFKINIPESHENKDKGWEEAYKNATFITAAANSREAIRAMRDENVKLKERLQISPEHGYDKIDGLEADVALLKNENVRLREALIRLVTCSDPFVSEIATNVLNGDYVEFRPDGKDFTVYGDDGNKTTYVRSEQEKGKDHE